MSEFGRQIGQEFRTGDSRPPVAKRPPAAESLITIEDFTLMAIGFVEPLEGEVSRCPVCGRNGVVKRTETEEPRCIHTETSELCCDGMRTEPTDCCRLPQ